MRAALLVSAATLGLASCSSQLKRAQADMGQLLEWLPGSYDNVEQAQEDSRMGREPHTALSLFIVPIDVPLFSHYVFYVQETSADDPRRITSQRLISFDALKDGRIVQTVYTFTQPGRWRDGHLNADLFKGMMYQDMKPLAGCEIEWKKDGERFVGANQRERCRVTSAALGGSARMDMRAELSVNGLATAELAYDASNRLVQGHSAEPFYRFQKRGGF